MKDGALKATRKYLSGIVPIQWWGEFGAWAAYVVGQAHPDKQGIYANAAVAVDAPPFNNLFYVTVLCHSALAQSRCSVPLGARSILERF
jgi:hypothetical protein